MTITRRHRSKPGLALAALVALGCGSSSGSAPVRTSADEPSPSPSSVADAPADRASPSPADVAKVNEPGAPVELSEVLASGKVTVVEFFADWCMPCRDVERRVLAVMAGNRAVALRKVDIGADASSPVAKQHNVKTIPSVLIFDRNGQLRYTLEGKQCNQAAEIAGQLAR